MLNEETEADHDIIVQPKRKHFKTRISILITALISLLKFSKLAFLGKFLVGMLKASKFLSTFLSMGLTIVLYAQIYGWLFAVGFVAVIFIHEMGHYLTSQKLGLAVSAPMFIPFLGAFIKMKAVPQSVREEALAAMGGPAAGAFVTLVCLAFYFQTGIPYWAGLTYVSALINLLNLLPFGSLDGGRIAKAISPFIWVIGLVLAVFLIWKFHIYILILIVLFGITELAALYRRRPETARYLQVEGGFRLKIGVSYLLLIAVLSLLTMYSLAISQGLSGSIYQTF